MTMQTHIPAGRVLRVPPVFGQVALALWQSRVLIGLTLAHLAIALGIAARYGVPFESGVAALLMTMVQLILPLFLVFLLAWRFGYTVMCVRPQNPTRWFFGDLSRFCLDGERILTGILLFVTISVFVSGFTFFKEMLPQLNPFSWDPALARLDRWLHGGTDPYKLLAPLLDAPIVTTWLNRVYHMWFFLLYFITFMVCFDRENPVRRNAFLVGFVLTWGIGGNLLAIVFASGGPVYFQAFGYGDTFVPLMDKLHAMAEISPISALNMQANLLDGYLNDGPMKGISAMPSMHLASSTLMTCHAFAWRRWAGWMMVAFTTAIMLGSVHLGWHYALDGYFGIALGAGFWFLARGLSRRMLARG